MLLDMTDVMVSSEGLEHIMRSDQSTQADLDKALSDVQMNYESFNLFVVSTTANMPSSNAQTNNKTNNKVELVFHRDGLSWKLVGVRIPSLV